MITVKNNSTLAFTLDNINESFSLNCNNGGDTFLSNYIITNYNLSIIINKDILYYDDYYDIWLFKTDTIVNLYGNLKIKNFDFSSNVVFLSSITPNRAYGKIFEKFIYTNNNNFTDIFFNNFECLIPAGHSLGFATRDGDTIIFENHPRTALFAKALPLNTNYNNIFKN
jgi:hypothetical protein